MDNAICIINYNGNDDTLECLESLFSNKCLERNNILLLDNGSILEEYNDLKIRLRKFSEKNSVYIKIINNISDVTTDNKESILLIRSDINLGFAGGNNVLINLAIDQGYKYCTLLNNDTVLVSNTIDVVKKRLEINQRISVGTCNICYFDKPNTTWNAGGKILFGYRFYYKNRKVQEFLAKGNTCIDTEFVSGCFMIIKASVLMKYGVLSSDFFFGEEDYEFACRMKKNKIKCVSVVSEKILHKVSSSVSNKRSVDQPTYGMLYWVNRYIDMKKQYSNIEWYIWKFITSFLLFTKRVASGKGLCKSYHFVHMIWVLSQNYDCVDKELTEAIWNNNLSELLVRPSKKSA